MNSQTRSWADDREAGGYPNAPSEDCGWPQMSLAQSVAASDRMPGALACRVRGVYHMIDTTKSRRLVMAVARVFRTGRSQAIRLPKEFRVEADTVYLKRTGEGFLVITREPWEIFFEGIEQLSDKFLSGERVQPELESRD